MLKPTLALVNGCFWTMDGNMPITQAIAITDRHIVAVGTTEEILATVGPDTEIVNLEGRVAVPGLADIHVHLCQDAADAC